MSDAPAVPILLPQVGNSMEEGTILAWRVREGDRVQVGDVLYELETDKANMEIEAEVAGRIAKIVAPDGTTVPIQSVVAYLGEEGAAIMDGPPAPPAASAGPHRQATTEQRVQPAGVEPSTPLEASRQRVSPAARRAAEALGVDLASVPAGSGPGGRVVRADVESAATQPAPAPVSGDRVPMSKMRRAIARNMQLSQQTVPHFYVRLTIDAGPLEAAYRQTKAQFTVSLNDFVVAAVARAVMEFPAFRQQADGDHTIQKGGANIGIAVGMDDGLVVPVLTGAENLSLKGIAEASRRIVESARHGKLEGMGQGVFTISNLGMFGVEEFAAIVNPPESGILAVGALRETVTVQGGALRAGKAITMTLSVDHRVVDGVLAAKFMARLRELLEDPAQLGG